MASHTGEVVARPRYASSPDPGAEAREPVLDGIRGLAIAVVLFHHCVVFSGLPLDGLPNGLLLDRLIIGAGKSTWLGVDLFFVLSGFLITGILYEARDSAHYFRNFYGRRALRIFPLYYAFLAAVFLVLPVLLTPADANSLIERQAWYWLYLSNIDAAMHGWQDPVYLGHFWSLAVEEQFYLVWPLVVYAANRASLLRISLLCCAAALALRFLVPQWFDPLANYVLMPTRMDAFAAGAVVAMLMRTPGGLHRLGTWPVWTLLAAVTIVALLALSRQGLSDVDPVISTVGFSFIALACASLIAVVLVAPPGSLLRRLFSSAVLTGLGKYSYALYVFHQPILLLLRARGFGADALPQLWGSWLPGLLAYSALGVTLTLGAAWLSWRFLEQPFQALKVQLPRPPGLPAARH